MKIGVPKETKSDEYRVGLVPGSVREFVERGHQVIVETNAGEGIYAHDDDYRKVGAQIVESAAEVFTAAEMIVKVKEPLDFERKRLRENQILFTYLHLAPDADQTRDLVESGAVCIAYETVTSDRRRTAATSPDVQSGWTHGGSGRGVVPRAYSWRSRHAAGRRSRR